MKATDYAEALFETLGDESMLQQRIRGLDRVLAEKGHAKLKASILKATLQKLKKKQSEQTAIVYIAKQEDEQKYAQAISALCTEHSITIKPAIHIDESLIGGFVFCTQTMQLDRSYKRALTTIYRSLTQ